MPDRSGPSGREQAWSAEDAGRGRVIAVTDNPIGRAVRDIAEITEREVVLLADEDTATTPLAWLAEHRLTGRDSIVLCDHDTPDMEPLLRAALATEAGYVAMMGSRRRAEGVFASLEDLPEAALARLHVPAGLNTGGKAPGEIALSVLAQIVAVENGRDGGPMGGPPS